MNNISSIETAILSVLNNLDKLDTEKTGLFNHFIVNNIAMPHLQEEGENSKFEARFFWPFHLSPEVYDFSNIVFNEKEYKHKITHDRYIINNHNENIKIRKNELHFKTLINQIGNIYQYSKKKKIEFPLSCKIINSLLNKAIVPDSTIIEGPEDLSTVPGIVSIDVLKERYVRKMEDRTKIEFGLIKIKEQQWKTICIESMSLRTVLLLSLLVNQKDAELLSYEEFLGKYAQTI